MKKNLITILALLCLTFVFIGCGSDDDDPSNTNTAPNMPGNFAATQTGRDAVALSWSSVGKNSLDSDADSVHIERSTNGETWNDLTELIGSATSYTDANILTNHQYWYRIHALNSYGESSTTAPVSIWTWPSVYDFSTNQTGNFDRIDDDPNGVYSEWAWDQANQAGKVTVNVPTDNDYRLTHITSDYTVPGQGVFETVIKVENWHENATEPSEVGFFIEVNPSDAQNNVVGIFCSPNSTQIVHYSNGNPVHDDDNNPILTENASHSIRVYHAGTNWKWYIDGSEVANLTLPSDVIANSPVYLEHQFDRGDGGPVQLFWVDNIARP